ncbi:MAG: PPOX class F420-dependent oxidoreductase [Halioglobus sp.]
MDANETDFIQGGNYISLTTRKRSGEWVATPVWFAPDEGSYYVFSAGDAGKVKRLRNFSDSRIAACTVTGTLTGELHNACAYVLDKPAEEAIALAALRRKYGWQMLLADFFSNLTGKMQRRVYVRIDP